MNGEVCATETDSEIALGKLRLSGIEWHLVTGKPSFVSQYGAGIDNGTSRIKVDVATHGKVVVLVRSLEDAA